MADGRKFGSFFNRVEGEEQLQKLTFKMLVNPFNLYPLMLSGIFFTWLRNSKLLMDNPKCNICNEECSIYKRLRNIDGASFRCKTHKNKEISIRKHSFFESTKYSIQDIMTYIVEYLLDSNMKKAALRAGITYGHTTCDYSSKIREIFMQYVWDVLKHTKLSGTVELDESQFGRKRKNNRGAEKGHKIWIFGKFS